MDTLIAFIIFGAVFLLVTGLTYAGVLMSIVWNRSLHDSSNFFLANLYVSDFLLSLAIFVHCMFSGLNSADKALEVRMLTVVSGLAIGSYCLSSVVVAADRYFRVARPLWYASFMTNTRCARIIAGSWALLAGTAIIWQLVITFLARTDVDLIQQFGDDSGNKTQPSSDDKYGIMISTSYVIFIDILTIPCLLSTACFCIGLVRIARAQARRIHDEARAMGHVRSRSLDQQVDSVQAGPRAPPSPPPARQPNRRRTNTYLRVYLASFVFCWIYPMITWDDLRSCQAVNVKSMKKQQQKKNIEKLQCRQRRINCDAADSRDPHPKFVVESAVLARKLWCGFNEVLDRNQRYFAA
ncbi:olfactory receptor 6B1-like [Patiria miniata]|uniref:G-protein coupled receptors family 1 profile domain-containing protein n=1 Tax=Patiria miniata TaxID=46514 RepID=A0A914ACR7_PATMI|nr:olfactory receptor 6B1-like [Patiria miniata]